MHKILRTMRSSLIWIFALGATMAGCSGPEAPAAAKDAAAAEAKDYFPVLDFLRGEIAYIDSFPLKMVRYRSEKGHKDSALIPRETFHSLAGEFLSPELEKASFEKEFTESSFLDQTSQSLSFTYSTANDRLSVRRVDVLASPSLGFDQVKSIYMEKVARAGDTVVLEKLYWKPKSNFQIIRILEPANKAPETSQVRVVWDQRE